MLDIRVATEADTDLILSLIKELADYEKAPHEVKATVEDIRRCLFSPDSTVHCLIAETEQKPIGFAVYFYNFSTWLGKNGIYLEDLYIRPEYRHMGAGKALLKHLAEVAVQRNCGRIEWNVLDWNEPALRFYESIGARPLQEWVGYRLEGENIKRFADSVER